MYPNLIITGRVPIVMKHKVAIKESQWQTPFEATLVMHRGSVQKAMTRALLVSNICETQGVRCTGDPKRLGAKSLRPCTETKHETTCVAKSMQQCLSPVSEQHRQDLT
jgi:hypothetical protein